MINKNYKLHKIETPFPYIKIENYLEDSFYRELDKSFPRIEEFKKHPRTVKRMNYDTTYGNSLYSDLTKNSKAFGKFHEYVYSKDFINFFIDKFRNNIQNEVQKNYLIDDVLKYSIKPEPFEVEGIIGKKELKKNSQKFLYPRLDIGIGIEGYGRNNGGGGIHIDNPQRLISILFYVGGYSEINGGEHRIWKKNPDNKMLQVQESIKPKKNLLIAGLQNNLAFHDVNPIFSINGTRNAFYLAISSNIPIWKRVKNNDFNLKYNKNRVKLNLFQKFKNILISK